MKGRRLAIVSRVSRSGHESTYAPRLRFIHDDPGEKREPASAAPFLADEYANAERRIEG